MITKSTADWDRIGELVAAEDPHGHLVSIHNFMRALRPHPAVDQPRQRPAQRRLPTAENTDTGGSSGASRWSSTSAATKATSSTAGATSAARSCCAGSGRERSAAATSGTARPTGTPDDEIWWSKGGELLGTSHARIGFLEDVVAASPTGVLEPLPSDFDLLVGRRPGPVPGQLPRLRAPAGAARSAAARPLARRGPRHLGLHGRPAARESTRRSCWCRCPPKPYQAVRLVAV